MDEEALKRWWMDKSQIGLSEAAVNALKEEGIEEPMDLAELSKDSIDTLVQNLKKDGPLVTSFNNGLPQSLNPNEKYDDDNDD